MAKANSKPAAKSTSKPSTAVVARKNTAVTQSGPVRAKRGMEEADADSFAIPFLRILQKMSPAIDEIKGAKPGMIHNTATGELYTDCVVIPVKYQRRFIHWGNRNANGGFKGMMLPSEAKDMEANGTVKRDDEGNRLFYPLPDGKVNAQKCDMLNDTRMHYVLLRQKDGTTTPALMSMSSTQIKKSKMWASKIANAPGESSADFAYPVSTVKESNDKGDWFAWNIGVGEDSSEDERAAAEAFLASLDSGAAQARFEEASSDE